MRLRAEVVDFVGLDLLDDPDQVGRVGQIAVVQNELAVVDMRILIQMVDAVGVEQGRTALDAVDGVAFLSRNSARYAPSWPVTPVISAVLVMQ